MPKDLKKFANPLFINAVPLALLQRLFDRHGIKVGAPLHADLFPGDEGMARTAILAFLHGPAEAISEGLLIDFHRIAELSNSEGLELLLQQARRYGVVLVPPGGAPEAEAPRNVAMTAFLDHPVVFEAASNIRALFVRTGIAEMAGLEEGREAQIDDLTTKRFEQAAGDLFEADLQGQFCEVDWYEDAAELTLVISHGAPMTVAPVVKDGAGSMTTFRLIEQAVLSYSAADGRLKMVGVTKSKRASLAEIFARLLLERPGFFSGPDAQNLYTLEPLETAWPRYAVRYGHEPAIRSVKIVEAQVDRVLRNLFGEVDKVEWSCVVRDGHGETLERLRTTLPEVNFVAGTWRIGHIVMRVKIDTGGKQLASVTVKVKPETSATFKRHRFEDLIMEMLRRNGLCCDRKPDQSAVAAE